MGGFGRNASRADLSQSVGTIFRFHEIHGLAASGCCLRRESQLRKTYCERQYGCKDLCVLRTERVELDLEDVGRGWMFGDHFAQNDK